jgi:uncharacterized protein
LIAPCEVAVKTVSPAIRALLAQKLVKDHDLKEIEAANILGITQSAVSKYTKKVRGNTIPIAQFTEIQDITNQMIILLLAEPINQTKVMLLFCQACNTIRSKGLMCQFCQQNQKIQIDNCDFCNKL